MKSGYNLFVDDVKEYEISFKLFQRDSVKAAKELYYGESVIKAIQKATTVDEISDIMRKAREREIENELCDPRR